MPVTVWFRDSGFDPKSPMIQESGFKFESQENVQDSGFRFRFRPRVVRNACPKRLQPLVCWPSPWDYTQLDLHTFCTKDEVIMPRSCSGSCCLILRGIHDYHDVITCSTTSCLTRMRIGRVQVAWLQWSTRAWYIDTCQLVDPLLDWTLLTQSCSNVAKYRTWVFLVIGGYSI